MKAESYNKKIKTIVGILIVAGFVLGIATTSLQEKRGANWVLYLFFAVIVIAGYFIGKIVVAREDARTDEASTVLEKNGFVQTIETVASINPLIKYERRKNYHKEINGVEIVVFLLTMFPMRHDPGTPALFFKIGRPTDFGRVLITKPNSAILTYINAAWLKSLSRVEFETNISHRLVMAEKNTRELWQYFNPSVLAELERMPVQTDLFADSSGIGLLLWDYRGKSVTEIQPLLNTFTAIQT